MSFQNFNDREDVLRRAKLIRGLDGGGGRAYVKPMGIQSEPQVSIYNGVHTYVYSSITPNF